VTAAVARSAIDHDHQLVDGYARYCQDRIDAGMISDRAPGPAVSGTTVP
jgi:hypothetical protein